MLKRCVVVASALILEFGLMAFDPLVELLIDRRPARDVNDILAFVDESALDWRGADPSVLRNTTNNADLAGLW